MLEARLGPVCAALAPARAVIAAVHALHGARLAAAAETGGAGRVGRHGGVRPGSTFGGRDGRAGPCAFVRGAERGAEVRRHAGGPAPGRSAAPAGQRQP